jgi:hypothetical protein
MKGTLKKTILSGLSEKARGTATLFWQPFETLKFHRVSSKLKRHGYSVLAISIVMNGVFFLNKKASVWTLANYRSYS